MPTILEEVAAIERQRAAQRSTRREWIPLTAAAERLGLAVETLEALCRQRKTAVANGHVYPGDIDKLAAALAAERAATAPSTQPVPAPALSPASLPQRPASPPAVAAAAPTKPAAPVKTVMQLDVERGEAIVENLVTLGVIRRPARARHP